ncbi:M23 family metallopeptidase [Mycobacterium sp. AMU20-3851]|uniref:M23 family metallopeptidase n=1 Tax=Mycobacterium sp. AMU20-3851 TaxID=3122055 RepID=UPI0037542C49
MRSTIRRAATLLGAWAVLTGCSNGTEPASPATDSSPSATAAPAPTPDALPIEPTPILAKALSQPVPVPATDGRTHLAYELYLTNATGQDIDLDSLTVNAGERKLLTLNGEELRNRTRLLGATSEPADVFGPAQSGVVWIDVALDEQDVPQQLSHTIAVKLSRPMPPLLPAEMAEEVAPVVVSTRAPVVISPPLRGPNWLAANSCCDEMTSHRMALNPISGDLWAAERFAIDYLQLDADGALYKGPATELASYPFYGADILAVADGPVVSVLDGLPEQIPTADVTGLTLPEYGGNHVVQDIGDGNYAFYAHLKTGSVQVKPGDHLSTGQVLGHLGNTGNTDAPHLHFHVMNTPDPLAADGLPFLFDSFTVDGRLSSSADLTALLTGGTVQMAPGSNPRTETDLSPLVMDVMSNAAN